MCHRKSINKHILEYKRDLQAKEAIDEVMPDDETFNKLLSHLSLQERGYDLPVSSYALQ